MSFLMEAEAPTLDWGALLNTLLHWAMNTGLRVIAALILLFISFRLINLLARRIERKAGTKGHDKTMVTTLSYIGKLILKCAIAVCLVSFVGIDTSGLTALITSIGVCFGLAVNGALSNFAGGVMLLITRPFRIDDYIEAQGYAGTVEEIHITTTRLRTPDNKVVYVPNGALSTGSVVNYSEKPTRRVDFTFSIAYSADFDRARGLIRTICEGHELVLADPAPMIRMSEHAASSINITARVWVKSADYWTVHFDILEAVKRSFDENGIEIPFNQLDVHVIQ